MEVKLFGLFKKKSQEIEEEITNTELPVIIPPARDRPVVQPTEATTLFPSERPQLSTGGIVVSKDDYAANFVFDPKHELASWNIPENNLQKNSTVGNATTTAPQPPQSPTSFLVTSNKKTEYTESCAVTNKLINDELVILPLGIILKSMPPEILSNNAYEAFCASQTATFTVGLSLREILSQLPGGKIEFPISRLLEIVPRQFFVKDLPTNINVKLPLTEIVNRLPLSRLGYTPANPANKSVNSVLLPDPSQPKDEKTEKSSACAPIVTGVSPTAATGTNVRHHQQASPTLLGISKPKPPLGAINKKLLPLTNERISLKQETQFLHNAPNFVAQQQADSCLLSAGSVAKKSGHGISATTTNLNINPAEKPPTALYPKIAPPPTESLACRADLKLPNISLAPTSKTKPPAIGGASRIRQSSSLSSREKLANLAELTTKTNQDGFSHYLSSQEALREQHFLKKPEKQENLSSHAEALFTSESIKDKSFREVPKHKILQESPRDYATQQYSLLNPENKTKIPDTRYGIGHEILEPQKVSITRPCSDSNPTQISSVENKNLRTYQVSNMQNQTLGKTQPENHSSDIIQPLKSNFKLMPKVPLSIGIRKTDTNITHSDDFSNEATPTETLKSPSIWCNTELPEKPSVIKPLPVQSIFSSNTPAPIPSIAIREKTLSFDDITPQSAGVCGRSKEPVDYAPQSQFNPHPPLSSANPSLLVRAISSFKRKSPTQAALHTTFALARWLGLESDSPVPIESVPVLLTNSPYIKGAAVIDAEGLTLSAHLPHGISENAIGALTQRLYQQAKTAATEMGSPFEGQCVVSLGRWTLQITHAAPFYLATFHDGLDFPPALARRLRKVAAALVRQETAI